MNSAFLKRTVFQSATLPAPQPTLFYPQKVSEFQVGK